MHATSTRRVVVESGVDQVHQAQQSLCLDLCNRYVGFYTDESGGAVASTCFIGPMPMWRTTSSG